MSINQIDPSGNPSENSAVQSFALNRPILVCFILFIIAQVFRFIDTFVFRLDEKIGEIIFTKSMGFILILVFLWLAGRGLKDIGLNSKKVGLNLWLGTIITLFGFVVGYGLEFLILFVNGGEPEFLLGAVDSKMGVTGGIWFALFLLVGNVINSFMEEGLFRGVMGRLARLKFGTLGANVFTAFMFGIWHLPWVLKYYQLGEIQTGGEIAMSIIFNSVPQFLVGLFYGYLYLKTGSLWGPWIAHAISNSIFNFLHVSSVGGLDVNLPLRAMVNLGVMLLCLLWVRTVAKKNGLQEVEAWT